MLNFIFGWLSGWVALIAIAVAYYKYALWQEKKYRNLNK